MEKRDFQDCHSMEEIALMFSDKIESLKLGEKMEMRMPEEKGQDYKPCPKCRGDVVRERVIKYSNMTGVVIEEVQIEEFCLDCKYEVVTPCKSDEEGLPSC